MKEFTASSGAKIVIGTAPFGDWMALQAAALREIGKAGISLKGLKLSTDMDVGGIISAFIMVASSPDVYAALWPCLIKSTHNGHKITAATFEDAKNRQDFYEVLNGFFRENLTLFLPAALFTSLTEFLTKLGDTQKPQ